MGVYIFSKKCIQKCIHLNFRAYKPHGWAIFVNTFFNLPLNTSSISSNPTPVKCQNNQRLPYKTWQWIQKCIHFLYSPENIDFMRVSGDFHRVCIQKCIQVCIHPKRRFHAGLRHTEYIEYKNFKNPYRIL